MLLLCLTRSLWGTGKIVVLDSGFCVLKSIIELKKKGVFSAALIKKRRYWPKYIDGDGIKSHFHNKKVGDVDALPGTLDEIPFHVFAMKEPVYVMMIMSTYRTCNQIRDDKTRRLENVIKVNLNIRKLYKITISTGMLLMHIMQGGNIP